jgi:putative ABC transport system substrate-binding protein
MGICLRRREFVAGFGGVAAAWPLAVRAQQSALPVVAFIDGSAANPAQEANFRKGLAEAGAVKGQNAGSSFIGWRGRRRAHR